jgi:hypothetical protein
MANLIDYLALEYPTATGEEIAMVLGMNRFSVRNRLGWTADKDSQEYLRRRHGKDGAYTKFVAIMKRRIG